MESRQKSLYDGDMRMRKTVDVEEIVRNIQESVQKEKRENVYKPRYIEFMNLIQNYKKIVIVGAGAWGMALFEQLLNNDIKPFICFADNAYAKYPNGLLEKAILPIEEAVEKYNDAGFVVTPRLYRFPLIKQLVNAGADINHIFIFDAENMGLDI